MVTKSEIDHRLYQTVPINLIEAFSAQAKGVTKIKFPRHYSRGLIETGW